MKQRYRMSHWQSIRDREFELDPNFARHLRESARPRQIAFQRLMSAFNGEPIGIECKSSSRDAWAFVLPDVAGEYPWRIQYFDRDGFSGHSCYRSLVIAVETMIGEGYRTVDLGALDRCTAATQWQLGLKAAELRLLFNQGLITWAEMCGRYQVFKESFQAERMAA